MNKTYDTQYTNDELQKLTEEWARLRLITVNGNTMAQTLKLLEEAGELASAINKGLPEAIEDAIGDCMVVLTNLAVLSGTTTNACWNKAYHIIKDREGFLLPNGIYVKDTDYCYENITSGQGILSLELVK